MRKVLTGLLILFYGYSVSLFAQEAVPLTLHDALNSALANNKEIAIASFDEESAKAGFRQTNAVFLPQINLSYSAFGTNNPLNAFGFQLQQESIEQSDFNPALLNNPDATYNFMTMAEWKQPLLNMDMIYARKAANRQSDIYEFKTARAKEYLTFEVQKAYAQLQLAHQAEKVLEEALQTVNSIYKSTSDRFEKGFLQKSDVLNVQVQVTSVERQLAEAKSNVQNASDYLSLLMGRPTGSVYTVDAIDSTASVQTIPTQLPANRADFQAMQSAVAAQEMMMTSGKMSYVPKLNGFAEYLLNDNEAFGFSAGSYFFGAQLSWNIFDGTAALNKVKQQRIERDKLAEQLQYQKDQGQVELNKTIRQLQDARLSVRQQETAVEQASEALRILQNRYAQGMVTTNDLLQSQNILSQQKLNKAQAVFQFNTTSAYLQFLTSTTEK